VPKELAPLDAVEKGRNARECGHMYRSGAALFEWDAGGDVWRVTDRLLAFEWELVTRRQDAAA
jgi:hypothetical protein